MRAQDAIRAHSKEYEDHLLSQRLEHMFRKYAPKGRESEYHMDLMMLVRAIQQDAVKPYEMTMRKMMEAMPLMSVFPTPKGRMDE